MLTTQQKQLREAGYAKDPNSIDGVERWYMACSNPSGGDISIDSGRFCRVSGYYDNFEIIAQFDTIEELMADDKEIGTISHALPPFYNSWD